MIMNVILKLLALKFVFLDNAKFNPKVNFYQKSFF